MIQIEAPDESQINAARITRIASAIIKKEKPSSIQKRINALSSSTTNLADTTIQIQSEVRSQLRQQQSRRIKISIFLISFTALVLGIGSYLIHREYHVLAVGPVIAGITLILRNKISPQVLDL